MSYKPFFKVFSVRKPIGYRNMYSWLPRIRLTLDFFFFEKMTGINLNFLCQMQKPDLLIEKFADDATKLDKTVIESVEQEKHVTPGQQSMSMTETTKTQKIIRVKMEKEVSPGLLALEDKTHKSEPKIEKIVTVCLPNEESTDEIDRTSITKQSSLDFFKSKIRESREEEKQKEAESGKVKVIPVELSNQSFEGVPTTDTFKRQSALMSELKTSQQPIEKVQTNFDTMSRAQESYSMVREEKSSFSSKSEIIEKKIEPIFKKPQSDLKVTIPTSTELREFNLCPEPAPEMGFVPKTEKFKTYEDVSQKVKKLEEFHKIGSPVDAPSGGVRLLPLYTPKPEPKPKLKEEMKEVKKIQQERVIETLPALSWLTDDTYSQEDREVFQSTQAMEKENKIHQKWIPPQYSEPTHSYSSTQSTLSVQKDLRPSSPRPSAEAVSMEKLWAGKKSYTDYQPLKEYTDTLKPSGIYRPSSSLEPMRPTSPRPSAEGIAMEKLWTPHKAPDTSRPASTLDFTNQCGSPKPSHDGVAMDKIWAHRHKESHLNSNWPPPQSKEEKPASWSSTQPIESKPVLWSSPQSTKSWAPTTSHETMTSHQSSSSKSEEITTKQFRVIDYPKPPEIKPLPPNVPVTHYIAESRLIRQTQSMDRQFKYMSESSSSTSTQERYWQEDIISKPMPKISTDLKAPSLVKQYSDYSSSAFRSVQPEPPPEIGFAPLQSSSKMSYGKTFERDTKKDLYTAPAKPIPVRVAPKPIKPKMKRSNSLESKPFERFPDLEPFPFKPDPPKPKPAKCPPPPTPTKFVICPFTGGGYESDYDSRISVKWRPYESDNEDMGYRKVNPPSTSLQPKRPQSTGPEPLPPSRFENPPQFSGPPRPVIEAPVKAPVQSKKESFRSFTDTKKKTTKAVKTISPPKIKPGSPPQFVQAPKPKVESKTFKPPESGYMADTDEPFALRSKVEKSMAVSKRTMFEDYSTHSSMVNIRKRACEWSIYICNTFVFD